MDWMNYVVQLFDNEWYEKYDGSNAKQIRVPNNLLHGIPKPKTKSKKGTNKKKFKPRNLQETGMLSLSFMKQNKWFKADDYLSVVGSTSLESILRKYDILKRNDFAYWDECLTYARSLNLTGADGWRQHKRPKNIPLKPYDVYKDKWQGWGHFLGTNTVATYNIVWRNLEDALKFVHNLKLKNRKEWEDYCKSGKKPDDIPTGYSIVYGTQVTTGIWLGTNRIKTNDRDYLEYDEAQKIVSVMGFKNNKEYRKAHKEGKIPSNIPSAADTSYKKRGTWKGWSHFLGNKKYIRN
jgi:hypothetical protein